MQSSHGSYASTLPPCLVFRRMSFCPPWICKSQPTVVHMAALQHQVPGVGRIHLCPSWCRNVDFQGGWGFPVQKCRVGEKRFPTRIRQQNNGLDKGNNNLKSLIVYKKSGDNDTGEWLKKMSLPRPRPYGPTFFGAGGSIWGNEWFFWGERNKTVLLGCR